MDWQDNPVLTAEPDSGMLDTLLAIVDAPGGMARNLFAGQDILAGLFDPGKRATGADVLRNMGNDDPSSFASGAVDLLLDPLLLTSIPRKGIGMGIRGLRSLLG